MLKKDNIIIAALDMEWTGLDELNNWMLSTQISCIHQDSGKMAERIIYHEDNERLTMAKIRGHILDCLGFGRVTGKGMHIMIVGFFNRAEWSHLADKRRLINDMQIIHGSPVSLKPRTANASFPTKHSTKVKWQWLT